MAKTILIFDLRIGLSDQRGLCHLIVSRSVMFRSPAGPPYSLPGLTLFRSYLDLTRNGSWSTLAPSSTSFWTIPLSCLNTRIFNAERPVATSSLMSAHAFTKNFTTVLFPCSTAPDIGVSSTPLLGLWLAPFRVSRSIMTKYPPFPAMCQGVSIPFRCRNIGGFDSVLEQSFHHLVKAGLSRDVQRRQPSWCNRTALTWKWSYVSSALILYG